MKREVGKMLKNAMRLQNLRQIDVAKALGLSQNTISNYINGKRRPDSETLLKLCDFLSIDFRNLIQGDIDEESIYALSKDECEILSVYRSMEAKEQDKLLSYVTFLKENKAK